MSPSRVSSLSAASNSHQVRSTTNAFHRLSTNFFPLKAKNKRCQEKKQRLETVHLKTKQRLDEAQQLPEQEGEQKEQEQVQVQRESGVERDFCFHASGVNHGENDSMMPDARVDLSGHMTTLQSEPAEAYQTRLKFSEEPVDMLVAPLSKPFVEKDQLLVGGLEHPAPRAGVHPDCWYGLTQHPGFVSNFGQELHETAPKVESLEHRRKVEEMRRELAGIRPSPSIELEIKRVVGEGSFGTVFEGRYRPNFGEVVQKVAVKKVVQDYRFKNREVDIMKKLRHRNIVRLINYFYYSNGQPESSAQRQVYLSLILEFVPKTLYAVHKEYKKRKALLPEPIIQNYMYDAFSGLAYLHSLNICHRDIKPQNLLIDPLTHTLKIGDFGSAKLLNSKESNISYICSRFYRAPELVFGSEYYTTAVDIWGMGCVLAELLIGSPVFPGRDQLGLLLEMIQILGTPTQRDIEAMTVMGSLSVPEGFSENPASMALPKISPTGLKRVISSRWEQPFKNVVCDLLNKVLVYDPSTRLTARNTLDHPFFILQKDSFVVTRQ